VTAVANQIGAAIENCSARRAGAGAAAARDELALAHDLQLRLMPEPSVLKGQARVAVRCVPVGLGGWRLLHLPPALEGTHRRHAGRRVLARHVRRRS
jgi:hypothetical protein